ncbi:hypothetical protein PQX77_007601 [Marasmius sp. AFHP31]|nr:hypothetical protein PQX77_007601 [Marasmius sp. AFHP31]
MCPKKEVPSDRVRDEPVKIPVPPFNIHTSITSGAPRILMNEAMTSMTSVAPEDLFDEEEKDELEGDPLAGDNGSSEIEIVDVVQVEEKEYQF